MNHDDPQHAHETDGPARLVLRRAESSDVSPLQFFYDVFLRRDYFFRRGQLAEIVGGPYHQVYVAELDGVLVGAAVTTRGHRLVNLLVHPAYRGLHIGSMLLQISRATEVRAKVDITSGDPRGFYQANGFISTGQVNGKGNVETLRLSPGVNGNGNGNGAGGRAGRSQARQSGAA
ncbi:MAG: GNAT family N-acetyltransferase [Phycisphaerae bacterium]|jgi:GNAT superfamily N-acetyltransferase